DVRERGAHVLCLSARTEAALEKLVAAFGEHLTALEPGTTGDVCHTATAGRSHFNHRIALTGDSAARIGSQLVALAAGRPVPGVFRGTCNSHEQRRVVYLFTGQGSQYVGMGRALYDSQPVFRRALDQCLELL